MKTLSLVLALAMEWFFISAPAFAQFRDPIGPYNASGDDPKGVQERGVPAPPPARPLSGPETAAYQDLRAMRQELNRLDVALQDPAIAPQRAVAGSMPKWNGLLQRFTTNVAAMKTSMARIKDAEGVKRAQFLEEQGRVLRHEIGSLPADAADPNMDQARKKTKHRIRLSDMVITKVLDKSSP